MNLTAFFTDNGIPATGLTPTITVWELDGTLIINSSAMTEVAGGFYSYNFSGYDYTEDYVIQGYASGLPTNEQYTIGTNDVDSQRRQGITKQILGLDQSNFRMENQTYDVNGRLLTANMYTYETAADTNADTNRLHTYNIVSTYDVNGNLTSYKVTEQ